MRFKAEFFKKFDFEPEEVQKYWRTALHDFEIARKDEFPEVKFSYGYQALIKAGIALIAKTGKVKVRSVPGHHVKILQKMSEILGDPDIMTIGDTMRMKRNADFYGGGEVIGEKEAEEYLKFIDGVLREAEKKIKP